MTNHIAELKNPRDIHNVYQQPLIINNQQKHDRPEMRSINVHIIICTCL